MEMASKSELIHILNTLDLGKAIAELDDQLDNTFVESSNLFDFISDRYDVIRGAKGTGKSALLLFVYNNKGNFQSLDNVILVKANEHSGAPSFRKAFGSLTKEDSLEIYAAAWKIYIINLVYEAVFSYISLDDELEKYLKEKIFLLKKKAFLID